MDEFKIPFGIEGTLFHEIFSRDLNTVPDNWEPIGPGEILLGTMSDLSRAIYGLLLETREGYLKVEKTHSRIHPFGHGEENPVCVEHHSLGKKMELVKTIFWYILRQEYPQAKGIALRKGFQVVSIEEDDYNEEAPSFGGIMITMFEGGIMVRS